MSVSHDTSEDAARVQLGVYRRMAPSERLNVGLELTRMSRGLLAQGIRARHPEYSDEQVRCPSSTHDSFASNFHGIPRMTQDADLVIEVDEPAVIRLVRELEAEFYVSEEGAREAVRLQRLFNAIHLATGFKVELVIKKDRPFSEAELARRTRGSWPVARFRSLLPRTPSWPSSSGPETRAPIGSTPTRSASSSFTALHSTGTTSRNAQTI
jgi:hypothetical protein